jgi:chemotaxis protein MotB
MSVSFKSKASLMSLFMALVIGVLSGCVSSSKYKKLDSETSAQKAALEARIAALEQEKTQIAQQKEELAKSNEKTETEYNALLNQMAEEVQQGKLKVTQYKNMLSVDVAEQIFFASGSATLKTGGQEVLKKLAEALNAYPEKIIWVVGHTDNVPLAKAIQSTYPTNWELSVIRATNVVRSLEKSGVLPGRLIASGRGEFLPIAPNDTADGRQKNRRIEIMLIDKSLSDSLQRRPS